MNQQHSLFDVEETIRKSKSQKTSEILNPSTRKILQLLTSQGINKAVTASLLDLAGASREIVQYIAGPIITQQNGWQQSIKSFSALTFPSFSLFDKSGNASRFSDGVALLTLAEDNEGVGEGFDSIAETLFSFSGDEHPTSKNNPINKYFFININLYLLIQQHNINYCFPFKRPV